MIKIDCEKLRLFETVLEIDKDKNRICQRFCSDEVKMIID